MLPLDQPSFCVNIGPFPGYNVTDQSALAYDPVRRQLLIFGGGHAAAWEDAPLRMPLDTLAWEWCYAPTPKATMLQVGADGKYANLQQPERFWKRAELGLPAPARSPVSRHSYTMWLWSHAINRALLLGPNNAPPYGFTNEVTGGHCAEFDPETNEWAVLPFRGDWQWMFAEDPGSGTIFALWKDGLRVYDPRLRTFSGPKGPVAKWVTYGLNLVYFPPTDSFFFFRYGELDTPNGPAVYEMKVDRATWTPTFVGPLATNWHPRPRWQGTGLVYDSKAKLIVGNMVGGFMYGFRPTEPGAGEWLQHPVPTTAQPAAYTQAYVEELDAHFIITGDGSKDQTWAFRWDPAQARLAVDPRKPKATISVSAQTVATMQEACNIGGDVILSAGALYGAAAAAQIDRPVNVTGQGTEFIDGVLGGKGTFIVNASSRFADVAISGAKVPDMNGAGIRWQGGDLTLERVKLTGNQNGLLGGNGHLVMDDCDVLDNGAADGQSHGIYIQGTALSATVRNSIFNGTKIGHHFKSRAAKSLVEDTVLGLDFLGTESCCVDLPDGGEAVIRRCQMRQGPKTDNNTMVKYFAELRATHAANSLLVQDCTMESRIANGIGLRNTHPTVVALLERVAFVGTFAQLATGWHRLRSCTLNGQPIPDRDVLPSGDAPPAVPTAALSVDGITKDGLMYSINLRGVAANEPDVVDVLARINGGAHVATGVTPGAEFRVTLFHGSHGTVKVEHAFADAAGNVSPWFEQEVVVPDKQAPSAPAGPLEVVSIVWS
jgi:hypothetical protein